jgi:hypothetical protein
LFDLPLGDTPVWSITEERVEDRSLQGGGEELVVSVLPASTAKTNLDLAENEALGFPSAARALAEALNLASLTTRPRERPWLDTAPWASRPPPSPPWP